MRQWNHDDDPLLYERSIPSMLVEIVLRLVVAGCAIFGAYTLGTML